MFGPCFKISLRKKKHYNIIIIVPVEINDAIYRMEGIHNIPTVFKKLCGMPSNKKRNTGVVDIFRSEQIKNDTMNEEISLFQHFQPIK